MNKETMTIHEGLAELKMLDKRIEKETHSIVFASTNKHSNQKIGGCEVKDVIKRIETGYQSILDMIKRRQAIRHAISQSNANTKVMIGGVEYTVAEAIEMRKSGISSYEYLIERMEEYYTRANSEARRANTELETKADQYVVGLFGSREKATAAEAVSVRNAYIEMNTVDIVMMSDTLDKIDELRNFTTQFFKEVDSKLSVSNALTTITFEY